MKIDLTPIFQALIMLIAAIITWKVIPWIQARTTEQQKKNLNAIVRTLVFAAEQLYGAGKGEEKLDYVIAWLDDHGFKADRAEIEAAVYQAFNALPPLLAVPAPMGSVDTEITHWSLEQLMSFCELNGINTDACVTREDYMDAIEHGGKQHPEAAEAAKAPDAEALEERKEPNDFLSGRVTDEPPASAAESREG